MKELPNKQNSPMIIVGLLFFIIMGYIGWRVFNYPPENEPVFIGSRSCIMSNGDTYLVYIYTLNGKSYALIENGTNITVKLLDGR